PRALAVSRCVGIAEMRRKLALQAALSLAGARTLAPNVLARGHSGQLVGRRQPHRLRICLFLKVKFSLKILVAPDSAPTFYSLELWCLFVAYWCHFGTTCATVN